MEEIIAGVSNGITQSAVRTDVEEENPLQKRI